MLLKNEIKDSFLIQDLENLSGIKAHTIRIWEKRYDLLRPNRLNRNIREYNLLELQKLLNVSVLYHNGFKISELAVLTEKELFEESRKISVADISSNYYINTLIVSMYSFDVLTFESTYKELMTKFSFKKVFVDVFIPLLNYLGVLWQTNAIKPIHEHFISNLIEQKVVLNTASIRIAPVNSNQTFVLFLPEGEMHNLGLLFFNYCLKLKGENTLYLGGGLPFSNLSIVKSRVDNIHWVCSFVIDKSNEKKEVFLKNMNNLLEGTNGNCSIIGDIWNKVLNSNDFIKLYPSFDDFMK